MDGVFRIEQAAAVSGGRTQTSTTLSTSGGFEVGPSDPHTRHRVAPVGTGVRKVGPVGGISFTVHLMRGEVK